MKAVILFLISMNAFAGIRVIHGGGGYAEMKALTVLNRLNQLVKPCARQPGLCGLNLEESKILADAYNAGAFNTDGSRLCFTLAGATSFASENERYVSLPTQLLYDSEERPLPFAKIAAQVFRAWLSRPSLLPLRGDFDHLESLGERIFTHAQVEEQMAETSDGQRLHVLSLRPVNGEAGDLAVTLENSLESRDITAEVAKGLPCREGHAQLLALHGLHAEELLLEARAIWKCQDSKWQARLRLLPGTSGIKATVSAVQNLSCEEKLL